MSISIPERSIAVNISISIGMAVDKQGCIFVKLTTSTTSALIKTFEREENIESDEEEEDDYS
jgi:hypothetical protein